jgi:uncharacterized protein (TIGR02246 family)
MKTRLINMKNTFASGILVAAVCTPLAFAQDVPSQQQDETAIRTGVEAYVKAFNEGNAEAVAAFWSPEAVYTDRISGQQVVGREAIVKQFKELFESPGSPKLDVSVESIQFVSPNVAVEHGTAKILLPDTDPESIEYSAVYVRRDGKWLLDRVTDEAAQAANSNYEKLKALEWFVGSWVDQDENVRIVTDCNWTKNKNFMTRTFTVSADDNVELSGMQIIGWDAASKQIRSWTFDSVGGFSRGVWSKSKDRWYVHKKGTTADGKTTTAVNHVTPVDENTFAFQSTQRTLAGQLLPNINEVLVVRQ